MKQKVVCMIPARFGSERVKRKNLRLLNGKPLISYAIAAALKSGVFDEIYVNSEHKSFEELALINGVKFYKRDSKLASNEANNEDFLTDFIKNIEADIVVQLLPTSPLIQTHEIKQFVGQLIQDNLDTLISVVSHQIASICNGKEINFSILDQHKSSQLMEPVLSYATVLMGWTCESYKKNIVEKGCAYHGADGNTGYFEISGLSTIDIDNEDDFQLAEVAIKFRSTSNSAEPKYYESVKSNGSERIEVNVPSILKIDGVFSSDFEHENQGKTTLSEVIGSQDSSVSWCRRLVNTESNSATLISQLPGEGNRLHYHPDWNEWWYIVEGEWMWEIEGIEMIVKKGDVVFIAKNKLHKITAIGDSPAVRLAVSREDVAHIYPHFEDDF